MKKVYFIILLFVFTINLFAQADCPTSIFLSATGEQTYGGCDGTVTLNTTGGNPPYTFIIINTGNPVNTYTYSGNSTDTSHFFPNVCPGFYEGFIINSSGDTCILAGGGYGCGCGSGTGLGEIGGGPGNACGASVSPATPDLFVECSGYGYCSGEPNVTYSAIATGDAPPFQYSFNGGASWSSSGSTFGPGCIVFPVLVMDATGQIVSGNCIPSPGSPCYSVPNITVTPINTCQGNCDGGAIIGLQSASGPPPGPFTVYINGSYVGTIPNISSTLTISGYCAGSYTITIDNSTPCLSNPLGFTISATTPPTITVGTSDATCDVSCDGTINLSASGGTPPFLYSSDCGSNYQSSNTFSTLCPNTYCWMVKDASNCLVTGSETINSNAITFTSTDTRSECSPFTWMDGNVYTSDNNTATHSMLSVTGCDSVITLDLTIANTTSGTDIQTACDSFLWMDGNTYTTNNNTATYTLTNVAGCDSVVTLNLTMKTSSSGTDIQNACDSFLWIDGNTYTANNNSATHILTNAAGCDSVVTLNLTVTNSTTSTDIISSCDSYTWIDGNTYTINNNTATHTLSNAAGCDSVITLNLTINNSNASTDIISSCDSYTWIDGNTYTTNNNTATYTLTNATGCDSVVTLNLTINSVDVTTSVSGLIISSNNVGAIYQWLDCNNGMIVISGETNQSFTPQANGSYAVQLTENGCTDTSACIAITTVGIIENSLGLDFILFPNPNKGIFTIEFTELQKYLEIKIMSLTGQLIESQKLENSKSKNFELNQPDGVYLLEITNREGGKMVMKIIKE